MRNPLANRVARPGLNSNIITINLMEAVGEAQVFAERTGLGSDVMEKLIGEAFGPVAGGYSKRYSLYLTPNITA
jgi:3-hydroxyisobutyrate dehydrogenase-like beta-hydroxyacid dehydrogenase